MSSEMSSQLEHPNRLDIRLTITDSAMILQFRKYLREEWGNQKGAMEMILRKALREFLERDSERQRASERRREVEQ